MNHVTLMGRLGRDPDVRQTQGGKTVANWSMATSQGKDSDADWHKCVAWEKTAELAQRYLRKGARVGVEGRIAYRSWEKDGQTVWVTEIVVHRLTMIDWPDKDERDEHPGNGQRETKEGRYDYSDDDAGQF